MIKKKKKTSTKPLLLSLANIPLIYKKPKHDKKNPLFFSTEKGQDFTFF